MRAGRRRLLLFFSAYVRDPNQPGVTQFRSVFFYFFSGTVCPPREDPAADTLVSGHNGSPYTRKRTLPRANARIVRTYTHRCCRYIVDQTRRFLESGVTACGSRRRNTNVPVAPVLCGNDFALLAQSVVGVASSSCVSRPR